MRGRAHHLYKLLYKQIWGQGTSFVYILLTLFRGFGFVTFKTMEAVNAVINKSGGHEMKGRQVSTYTSQD